MLLVPLVPNFGFGILRLETVRFKKLDGYKIWIYKKRRIVKTAHEGKTIIDLYNRESEGFSISREYGKGFEEFGKRSMENEWAILGLNTTYGRD